MTFDANPRRPDFPIDPQFIDRWSPRAFDSRPVPRETLLALFEAARWAPSSRNEQPWLFVCADAPPALDRMRSLLFEANRVWADRVPVLCVLFARTRFSETGTQNPWAAFDCGAAWLSLALQARKLGLYAHAMGGFKRRQACEALGVPSDQYEPICAIAIGFRGDPSLLPPDLQEREHPNERTPVFAFVRFGGGEP